MKVSSPREKSIPLKPLPLFLHCIISAAMLLSSSLSLSRSLLALVPPFVHSMIQRERAWRLSLYTRACRRVVAARCLPSRARQIPFITLPPPRLVAVAYFFRSRARAPRVGYLAAQLPYISVGRRRRAPGIAPALMRGCSSAMAWLYIYRCRATESIILPTRVCRCCARALAMRTWPSDEAICIDVCRVTSA